tara:strand:+ start:809 stop:1072 length:264 start_codon:yes stop_codon:yes gene_type:complete
MRGKCESYYRFKVERLVDYPEEKEGVEEIETFYFKQQSDLTLKLGIPKSTIYIMIKHGLQHDITKWKNYFITKCKEPAFQKIAVEYI